ncbi:NAD(P)/FAD-dependent oxidoreductase [Alkalilacustris brevis]|uniref:NAD(P)/FAD-dependent oxidoreductase n=1 Tax=Alkalilacustris brevis TaxID=2026338 RepID=UPI000E0DE24F|nr:FAD-binding oxidoreductase [Alkalilacustris brevis]
MKSLLFANDRPGAYPPSWYAETAAPLAPFPPLEGEARADVCVIGGGYTGLSAALHLAQQGLSVILLEAHRVGFGASGRNGGQVGSGQRIDQGTLEARFGTARARQLWDLGEAAKALVRALITRHDMPCRFHPGIVHADWSARDLRHTHEMVEKLNRDYGYDQIAPLDRAALRDIVRSEAYQGGALDHGAGHIHPLQFALGLAGAAAGAGVRICEGSHVTRLDTGPQPVAFTAAGAVRADHLVLACNGYLEGIAPPIAARVMPINNFIIATEPLGPRAAEVLTQPVAVADSKFVVNYFRLSDDGRLLFGGGESYGYRFPHDIRATVRKPMLQVFPQLADVPITHAWGGTLAITMSRLPCLARPAPNVLSASGYSGHGVALATLAGKLMAEAIAGRAGRFDILADLPATRFPGGPALRSPLLALAMTWFALRDRLGL